MIDMYPFYWIYSKEGILEGKTKNVTSKKWRNLGHCRIFETAVVVKGGNVWILLKMVFIYPYIVV